MNKAEKFCVGNPKSVPCYHCSNRCEECNDWIGEKGDNCADPYRFPTGRSESIDDHPDGHDWSQATDQRAYRKKGID